MIDIKLIRKWFGLRTTIGELHIDGKFQCYICEDIARPTGVKVKGATAIPSGTFEFDITYSNRFKKPMPLIYNKSDLSLQDGFGVRFDGVRVHPGNTEADTEGCLLVGCSKDTLKEKIGESQIAFNKLLPILQRAKELGTLKTIQIINKQEC